jgi:hypothetical protein
MAMFYSNDTHKAYNTTAPIDTWLPQFLADKAAANQPTTTQPVSNPPVTTQPVSNPPVTTQPVSNPTVTNIGINQTEGSPQSTYNPYVTGLGFNQTGMPAYNPYAMWGGLPMFNRPAYNPYATLMGLPANSNVPTNSNAPTNGNAPTANLFKPSCNQPGYASSAPASATSLDNNLLSMGFQRGAAVR